MIDLKKVVFIKNAMILTVSSLILRFLGIVFKVWLAAEIGPEGIGLYQIIFSVYMLASTFAVSGISTAVTRLIADELALGSKKGVLKILKRCILITCIIALFSNLLLFFAAKPISIYILEDIRAVNAIKILSFSLPFMGISSCLRGYFIARRKAYPSAFSQLFEQLVRIVVVLLLIKKFANISLDVTCAAVLLGDTLSEAASLLLLVLIFSIDKKKLNSLKGRISPPFSISRSVCRIALPITSGRYLNMGLRTFENILVPKSLLSFNGKNSLAQFGMIKGMALPILFFPSTLLNSLSTLLIPEISEAAARKRGSLVKYASEKILQITSIISFIFAAIFLCAGIQIGNVIYKSEDVGFLLCALSPIVPFMYLDSVADGILKGLDQQNFCFKTGIFDSSLRIGLIMAILPFFGMKGFIAIMYFSNFLTCFLNIKRLIKISGASIDILKTVLIPICSAVIITLLIRGILSLMYLPNLVYIILLTVISIPLYFIFIFSFGCICADDIRSVLPKK